MLKQSSSRVKKGIAVSLAVLFVLSLTAVAASALGGWEDDGLYELGLASAHGVGGFGGSGHSSHGGHNYHGGHSDHRLTHVSYGSYGSIGGYGANCAVVNGALVCSSY
jgi:hypothetical protein